MWSPEKGSLLRLSETLDISRFQANALWYTLYKVERELEFASVYHGDVGLVRNGTREILESIISGLVFLNFNLKHTLKKKIYNNKCNEDK